MTGFDFFLYCLGLGTLLVACSGSVALFRSTRRKSPTQERHERVDLTAEGLAGRLAEMQQARYASPIVRRELPASAGPRERTIQKRSTVSRPAGPGPTEKG